jgi:glycerophosphoryl diester phosphodiesterase
MKILTPLQAYLRHSLDRFYARWPQEMPPAERLKQSKIISHRGDHDNRKIFENTLAAFNRARDGGVWGIEFDVRWTGDLHPVVVHDANLRRVFDIDFSIRRAPLAELKIRCPAVPTLAEVISRYGKKMHLMVEVKAETYPDPVRQNRILKELFSTLEPVQDFHLLTMTPGMFNVIDCVPAAAFLPVAQFNFFQFSKLAITRNYSGVAGHYVLLTRSRLKKHRAVNQNLATGYVNSINCLFRELNRGVEWIFSDNAVELQKDVNRILRKQ